MKRTKEIAIIVGFFVACAITGVLVCKVSYWVGIAWNPKHKLIETEEPISFDKVSNPDPRKEYFYKTETVYTAVAGTFPTVEEESKKRTLGIYERNK